MTGLYNRLRLLAAAILLFALPCAWGVWHLEIDNRQEQIANQTGPEAEAYRQFVTDFGDDEFILVAVTSDELFAYPAQDAMLDLLERLESIPAVKSVNGMPLLFREIFGEEDIDALYAEMTNTDFYADLFISRDERIAGLSISLNSIATVAERSALLTDIEAAVGAARGQGLRVDLVGGSVFNNEISKITAREKTRTFPIAGIAALAILLLLLRSTRAALAVLLGGGFTLLLTLGTLHMVGWKLNLITSFLPLVLLVLSISNGIHISSRYQRILTEQTNPVLAIEQTVRELTLSCALSSVTTALGFLSLLVADLNSISQMGIYMALGILFSFAVNISLGACLLVLFGVGPATGSNAAFGAMLASRLGFVTHRPGTVIGAFALFTLAGIVGVTQIKPEGDTMEYLPQGSPVTESFRYINANLTGLTPLEVVVETPGGWLSPGYTVALAQLERDLQALPESRRVFSPLSMLKKMNQWSHDGDPAFYRLPDSAGAAQALMAQAEAAGVSSFSGYVSAGGDKLRISLFAEKSDGGGMAELKHQAESLLSALPAPLHGHTTGIAVQMSTVTEGLVETQLKSYSLAFVLIFGCIWLGLRSPVLLGLGILPNLIPMLTIFLIMWLANIGLNTATVMVASISLGIAVDNTVHFLNRYRRQQDLLRSGEAVLSTTIQQIGPSITISTLTTCIGFYGLAPSAFEPISHLGMLTGSAILMALLSNLLLLPAIISLTSARQ